MLSKLTRGNQITIPKAIVKRIGLKVGSDYLEVAYLNGFICLKPVTIEERFTREELEKLVKNALKEEKQDTTLTTKEAEGFLHKRAKKV